MMKKKIICAIVAVSSICMNAFAATDVSMVGNKVTVEADIESGKWGTLIVTKSGDSLDDENIIAMKQAKADANGKAVFKFSMPGTPEDEVNGKYDLHIKNGDGDIVIEDMYYALPNDRNSIMEGLKTETDIKATIENEDNELPLRALGVHVDNYNVLKEMDIQNGNTNLRDSVCNMFADACVEDMTDEDITKILNAAIIIQQINAASGEDTEIIEKLGFAFENVRYIDAEDKTKSFVSEYIYANKPYTDVVGIERVYETANMLHVINNTRFDDMESKLAGYAQSLGIAEAEEYLNYTESSKKNAINEDIAAALKKKAAITVQELLSVIDTATKNNPPQGGNGGGGGGGTINTPSNPLATVPVVNNNRQFGDIDDVTWAKTAILALVEKGIIAGDENGNFNPNNFVKREEFVKMLVMAAGMHKQDAKCTFDDVKDGAWYSSYVASAYNSNMVYGISEKEFGVGSNITRQDMAVMCYRASQKSKPISIVCDSVQFTDAENISDYAKAAVAALYEADVINGIGNDLFDPTGTATRAQAAVIIYNLFIR